MLADATYKLVVEGFPILTVGTTDKTRQFYPFGYAMVFRERCEDFQFLFNSVKKAAEQITSAEYKPNVLIADNAPAIENGFISSFGNDGLKRINCWAHAIRNIDDELTKIKNKVFRTQIRSDICNIQLSCNERIFKKLTQLFESKWRNKDNSCDDFMQYFQSNWVENKSGWYEGFSVGDPSTSNAIECSHKYMKKDTNHSRKPAIKFMHSVGKELVEEWSNARNPMFNIQGNELSNPNCKIYEDKPKIETVDWTEALKWNSKQHSFIKAFSTKDVYCTSDTLKCVTKNQCREITQQMDECLYDDFDDMVIQINEIRMVKLNLECWENSECNCENWLKFYKCNHIISLAARLKLCSFAQVAYSIPILHKRKRGQPAKTASALLRQPNEIQAEVGVEECPSSLQESVPIPEPMPKKRGRPKKIANMPEDRENVPPRASKRLRQE